MDILEPQYDLFKYELCVVLLQLSSAPDKRKQVTTTTDFHHVHDVRLIFETLVQPNDVLMSGPLQNVILLLDLLQRALIVHECLVDRLQSYELSSQPMNGQVYFPEGSFADYLTNLIIVDFSCVILFFNVLKYRIIN